MATRFGKTELSPADTRLAQAIAHPLRAQALTVLNARVASPSEIAEELEVEVSNVSYHIKRLLALECIELVNTRASRGAIEHFYKGVAPKYLTTSFWEKLRPAVRDSISMTGLRVIFGAIRDSVNAGIFDRRKDRHLAVVTYQLDEQGWREIGKLYDEALDRTMDIAVEAAGRLAEVKPRNRKALRATFVQLAFESPQGSPDRHELGGGEASKI